MDRRVTAASREEIILQSIEKLIERDDPSLETIKMQVRMLYIYLVIISVLLFS